MQLHPLAVLTGNDFRIDNRHLAFSNTQLFPVKLSSMPRDRFACRAYDDDGGSGCRVGNGFRYILRQNTFSVEFHHLLSESNIVESFSYVLRTAHHCGIADASNSADDLILTD